LHASKRGLMSFTIGFLQESGWELYVFLSETTAKRKLREKVRFGAFRRLGIKWLNKTAAGNRHCSSKS
jgi:hypothetical protein